MLGASPDALIHHADGTIEVAEVKCSSPFMSQSSSSYKKPSSQSASSSTHHHHQSRRMVIAQNARPYDSVGSWHIPQLQLEILCAGPQVTMHSMIHIYNLCCI